MDDFIEGYCDQQLPPPYTFQGVRVWSFPLLAGFDKVQSVVKKYLEPEDSQSPVLYNLIQGSAETSGRRTFVYMMVLDYRKMACKSYPESEMGSYAQKELLFGIPVVQKTQDGPRISLFCPYIFVDNGGSMVCGNTVLGYPKQPAWFQVPPQGGRSYPIQIDAPVMAREGPGAQQTWQRLVHVRAVNRLFGDPVKLAGEAIAVAEGMAEAVMDAEEDLERTWPFGPIERLLGQRGPLPVPQEIRALFRERPEISYGILQLKQIRSAEDPTKACYRSLLSCTSKLIKLRSFGMLPDAVIELASYPSLDIAEALGLESHNGKVRPWFPYRMQCDFDFIDARERAF
ncbi:MAG TPA: hypothetical protein VKM72_17365 [Thermoanaerobaculia bacterium]|nr:hypothetical protein [Thermoanaerobaculia bacterium]